MTDTPRTRGFFGRVGAAVPGAVAMAFSLALATFVADSLQTWWRLGDRGRMGIAALVCAAAAVTLIALLQRRLNHRPMTALGLNRGRGAGIGFIGGAAICLVAVGIMAAVGTAAGWLWWGPIEPGRFALFLLINGLVALGLEALPEELSFRGYVWSTLRDGGSAPAAFVLTTAVFMCVVGLSSVFSSGFTLLASGRFVPPTLTPAGENPFDYLFLLACFGSVLLTARIVSGSVWTSIGFHLAFLTVNRTVFFSAERGTGWDVRVLHPDAVLLVPAYLMLALVIMLFLRRVLARIN